MRRAIRLHARGPALAWRPSPRSRALRPLSTSTSPPSDAYQVLGVSSSASADELRDAYRQLAKEWHPDVHQATPPPPSPPWLSPSDPPTRARQGPSSAAAGARFQEIAQAYQTLSDSARRAEYDAEIAAAKSDEARAAATQARSAPAPRMFPSRHPDRHASAVCTRRQARLGSVPGEVSLGDISRRSISQRFRAASWDVEVPDVRERMRKGARDNAAGERSRPRCTA